MSEQPLPEGWYAYQDSEARTYYANPATGESRWDRPPAGDAPEPSPHLAETPRTSRDGPPSGGTPASEPPAHGDYPEGEDGGGYGGLGGGSGAPPIQLRGYDPHRFFSDDPRSGCWRELQDPVSGRRYWNHIGVRITTWSFVELVRLGGLEEFLLLGEWNVFACVPEAVNMYEDLEWHLPCYADDRCSGDIVRNLGRGEIVASCGMPRPGVLELMLADESETVRRVFAPYRMSFDTGPRMVQRLPARENNDDLSGMVAVTVPTFRVLPGPKGPSEGKGLIVTSERDPRSEEMGRLAPGELINLQMVLGTRAQLARNGPQEFWGCWITLVLADGRPCLERLLPETENMQLERELQAHLKALEAAAAGVEHDEPVRPGSKKVTSQLAERPPPSPGPATGPPGIYGQLPNEMGMEQRLTVAGGWRQMMDEVWGRPVYHDPIAGRTTWGLTEVLQTGGLDDLLLARNWEACAIDPLAVELMKDKTWTMSIFSDRSLSGEPIATRYKGDMIIVQHFERFSQIATVLVPPVSEGGECAMGYTFFKMQDGRPLLRYLLPPVEEDDPPALREDEEREYDAHPPEGATVMDGPYFCQPPGDQQELWVSVGQDVGSERWARLPRGYVVRTFAEVLGFRARLPDLEGGGWVSLFGLDGTPYFRKAPSEPPGAEGQQTEAGLDAEDAKLPIVWPGLGIIRAPYVPVPSLREQAAASTSTLPELLGRLGGGRALCDWQRLQLQPSELHVWKSPLTFAQTTLHQLLENRIWKAVIVEMEFLNMRERLDPRSAFIRAVPRGAVVVAEWVAPGGTARLLAPQAPDDARPAHAWADIGQADGIALRPLAPGGDFWIEPRGGHLLDEQQADPDAASVASVKVRAELDAESARAGYLQRGDAVQLAEVRGRFARVVHTKCIEPFDTAPNGGWIDMIDEAGWSVLKARQLGDEHPEEIARRGPKVLGPDEIKSQSKRSRESSRRGSQIQDGSEKEEYSELPALLWQIGELEGNSVWTRDWREAVDPVWGRRYYVNRWSGQIIHKLQRMGVAAATVRLTMWFSNLSMDFLREQMVERPEECEHLISQLQVALLAPFAALADVPEDMVELRFEEGFKEGSSANPSRLNSARTGSARSSRAPTADSILGRSEYSDADSVLGRSLYSSQASETGSDYDSILGSAGGRALEEEESGFRVVTTIKAPGARAAWASGGLKRAMADGQRFTANVLAMMSGAPGIFDMREDQFSSIALQRADLEELDVPRLATCFEPPPPPPPPPPLPVDDDIRELAKNCRWNKHKLLQFHCRPLGLGNVHALAEGLETMPEPTLEELGLWGCDVGDRGAVSLASALNQGIGINLQTLLLDENMIAASGATALGVGLRRCEKLRELGVARNPLGAGFMKLLAGLGASIVVLDATDCGLDDRGAISTATNLPRWPQLRSLRLGSNNDIGPVGVESIIRGLLGSPSLKLADLKGASVKNELTRFQKLLLDGGAELSRVRL